MIKEQVKNFMVPIEEYATVGEEANLVEAILALESTYGNTKYTHPHRAVLVKDSSGKIVGKIGHLSFLRALDPKQNFVSDMEKLSRVDLSNEFIDIMMSNMNMMSEEFTDLCQTAKRVVCKDIMQPLEESVNSDTQILTAMRILVVSKHLSLPVMENDEIIGLLRLTDVYGAIANFVKECYAQKNK